MLGLTGQRMKVEARRQVCSEKFSQASGIACMA